VLTAGHCVVGIDDWIITLPYDGEQRSHASWGEVYDYQPTGDSVNPAAHDVGLVFLDAPLALDQWPQLANQPLADGSMVVNIGRIDSGQYSASNLYVSNPVGVVGARGDGFPFDYAAQDMIQPGDSGGPTELASSASHVIVAVNSGVGGKTEVLARIDMLTWWIVQEESSHGGAPPGQVGPPGDPGGTGGAGAGAGAGPSSPPYRPAHDQAGSAHGCSAALGQSPEADALILAGAALLFARVRAMKRRSRRHDAPDRLEGDLRR
jgi:hypothetical protein